MGMIMTPQHTREQFSLPLLCPVCGQDGQAVWEENAFPSTDGLMRVLIDLSPGFRHKDVPTQSGDPVIACNKCDASLPD